jgi:hypothetical protein
MEIYAQASSPATQAAPRGPGEQLSSPKAYPKTGDDQKSGAAVAAAPQCCGPDQRILSSQGKTR